MGVAKDLVCDMTGWTNVPLGYHRQKVEFFGFK